MDEFDFSFDEFAGFPDIDFGGGDIPSFDWGNVDFGGVDFGNFDITTMPDFGFDLSGIGSLDLGELDLSDLANFGADVGLDLGGLDFNEPTMFDFGRGEGLQDISSIFSGEGSRAAVDTNGNLVFYNEDGTQVVYTPEGVVQTVDPSGPTSFYHTNEGQDYFVDYTDPSKAGSLIETFNRAIGGEGPTSYGAYHTSDGRDYFVGNEDVYTPGALYEIFSRAMGGEGPTRYTAYSGTGKDAKVVDYSDVYGPNGGTVTTTSDGKTTVYKDGQAPTTTNTKEKSLIQKFTEFLKNPTGTGDKDSNALLYALLGGLLGLLGRQQAPKLPVGYQGGIPTKTATRAPIQSPTAGGRRPGGAGIGSLAGNVTYAAEGGLLGLAGGGAPRPARYLRGGTDGMADRIKSDIDGKQPARLSHGEFVVPADVVSHLGNGNSDAGADVLYDMMEKVRKARTGTPKQGKQINPRKFTPV